MLLKLTTYLVIMCDFIENIVSKIFFEDTLYDKDNYYADFHNNSLQKSLIICFNLLMISDVF